MWNRAGDIVGSTVASIATSSSCFSHYSSKQDSGVHQAAMTVRNIVIIPVAALPSSFKAAFAVCCWFS